MSAQSRLPEDPERQGSQGTKVRPFSKPVHLTVVEVSRSTAEHTHTVWRMSDCK